MQSTAKWLDLNAPSGIPGNQFMGSIHPRLKRPVGRRLAHAAAHLLLQQHQQREKKNNAGSGGVTAAGGAATGPTIAGCRHTAVANTAGSAHVVHQLVLQFNTSLLGGEALLLRKFDANETGGWSANPYNDSATDYHPYRVPAFDPSYDSLGAMVCTADAATIGNASTCACQSWDWTLHNGSDGTPETIWFCETGPAGEGLWRPPAGYPVTRGRAWHNHRATRYLPTPNLFRSQWAPAPLKTGPDTASVAVDLSVPRLKGKPPLAVRYAWPLFGGFHGATADTCCPTRSIQDGHGPCLPASDTLSHIITSLTSFFKNDRIEMCFAPVTFWCWVSQPNHVSNPD